MRVRHAECFAHLSEGAAGGGLLLGGGLFSLFVRVEQTVDVLENGAEEQEWQRNAGKTEHL